ncbi:MAG TPA: NADH:flavin oxidoreductase, partial [Planctomycetota bacterium]|nr:NADH:flavin oxidoreductase [Planctomycetota bacterium]
VDDYARCAALAREAGYDGVEIMGSEGYLLTQFLVPRTNQRDDAWGGSLEKRARFLREVYRAARAVTGADFLIGVRFSPELEDIGIDLDESLELVRMLESDGVDFLHVSNGDSFRPPRARPESERRLTAHVRAVLADATPLIATGAVWTRDDAETVLRDGADFVGVARAAIGNADWARAVEDAAWQAARPPYSVAHLSDQGLGEAFIAYMRRWPDFVVD